MIDFESVIMIYKNECGVDTNVKKIKKRLRPCVLDTMSNNEKIDTKHCFHR